MKQTKKAWESQATAVAFNEGYERALSHVRKYREVWAYLGEHHALADEVDRKVAANISHAN